MTPPQPTHQASDAMSTPPRAPLDPERCTWLLRQRPLLQRHGRAVTLAIALRHVRSAGSEHALLATIEEILVHHVGVEVYVVLAAAGDARRVLAARGPVLRDARVPPLARVALGAGDWTLGELVIYRLVARKSGLDAFDHELLAALGPQIAVALHAARLGMVSQPARVTGRT